MAIIAKNSYEKLRSNFYFTSSKFIIATIFKSLVDFLKELK